MVTPFHLISQFIHQHQALSLVAFETVAVLVVAVAWIVSTFKHLLHMIWSELYQIRQHLETQPTTRKQEDASNG